MSQAFKVFKTMSSIWRALKYFITVDILIVIIIPEEVAFNVSDGRKRYPRFTDG